jgi:crotonobetainyl-CoA:carnitine CoA-transferase CaiB-like acyl-CoA transferase
MPMKALDGLKVLDLSRVLAGPYCGQLLADMGADVLKVESPEGDENRKWPPLMDDGESCNFGSVNRGKRSLTLNLKEPRAQAILHDLVKRSDVLLHSFLPDVAARLGCDIEAVQKLNPRMIVCTISGYGGNGPLRNKPGYDLMVQAFSGIMSTTGFVDGPPVRTGVSFIDMSTGLSAYAAIMTALVVRGNTGRGTAVRASLLESAINWLGYHAVAFWETGYIPKPEGSGVWHLVPYQAFRCSDGWMLAGATNDAVWLRFCDALELPELAKDERFHGPENRAAKRDILVPMLEAQFATKPVAHWMERMEARRIPASPLHTLDQILTHPQVEANGLKVSATRGDKRMDLVGTPFKLGEGGGVGSTLAPSLGADTDAILAELGYSATEIAEMRGGKVI